MTTPVAELPTTLAEAHALIAPWRQRGRRSTPSLIASEIATLTTANADLAAVSQTADARIVERS